MKNKHDKIYLKNVEVNEIVNRHKEIMYNFLKPFSEKYF